MYSLYHYYEKSRGPFRTLSDLAQEESVRIHTLLESENQIFAARSDHGRYMENRRIVEQRAYAAFLRRGGKPHRRNPYYMVLAQEESEECKSWFHDCGIVKIPLDAFDPLTVSFTYGDSFPTFKPIFEEEPEYPLYLKHEIFAVIEKRGMPPVRTESMSWLEPSYIEAQVWSGETIARYRDLPVQSF
jgi:hypothetical protein